MAANYVYGYQGYNLGVDYSIGSYDPTATVAALTFAKGSAPAVGDIVLFGDSFIATVATYVAGTPPTITFTQLGSNGQYSFFVPTTPIGFGDPYAVINQSSGGSPALVITSSEYIGGYFIQTLTSNPPNVDITSSLPSGVTPTTGLIVFGQNGLLYFYGSPNNTTTTAAWYNVTPLIPFGLSYFNIVDETPANNLLYEIDPSSKGTPSTILYTITAPTSVTYYFGTSGVIFPSSPNDGDYFLNTTANNAVYFYTASYAAWSPYAFSSTSQITFYNQSSYQTYIVTEPGIGGSVATLTELTGYYISTSTGVTPPVNNYAVGSYILYYNTNPSVETATIWVVQSGGTVQYTQFSYNFIFRATNGSNYLCSPTGSGSQVNITTINGGVKLNQAIIYKYTQTGFLDTTEASNLLEPSVQSETLLISSGTTGTQTISNIVPSGGLNPLIQQNNVNNSVGIYTNC